jgi:hypothetical protein
LRREHRLGPNESLGALYEEVMGFRNILSFDDSDISTECSAFD